MKSEELDREDFGIDVQIRPAVGKAERERGVQVFRTASMTVLEGARLQKFVEGTRLDYRLIAKGALELGDLIRTLAMWGCGARLKGLGILSPVASGQCMADDPDPRASVKISYHMRLEKGLQDRVQSEAKIRMRKMPSVCPELRLLKRTAGNGVFDGQLDPGEPVVLKGRGLKYDPENPAEGVFFENPNRPSERIRVEQADVNNAYLVFLVPPEAEPGKTYRLVVRAKMFRCKDVREGIFHTPVTITA